MDIAGYTMVSWVGEVPPMANMVSARERAGTDGYTFVLSGKRSPVFTVRTRSTHASTSAARSRAGDYERLIGTFVTAEDQGGRPYGKLMVLGVTCRVLPLLNATDGSDAMIEASWTLQRGR